VEPSTSPTPIVLHERRRVRVRRRRARARRTTIGAALVAFTVACVLAAPAIDAALKAREPVIDGRVIGHERGRGPRGVHVLIRDPAGPAGHRIVYLQHEVRSVDRGTKLRLQRSVIDPDLVGEPARVRERRAASVPIVVALLVLVVALLLRAVGLGLQVSGGRRYAGR
jgi:hypothetical protein